MRSNGFISANTSFMLDTTSYDSPQILDKFIEKVSQYQTE